MCMKKIVALVMPCLISVAVADEVENVLVTGSYAPQAVLTSSVTVLDGQQIAALNKRTLAGILKTVPGLLVEEQGGPGGLTAVSIRGGEANFTLVLLDGVPVNDPTNSRGGSFDFANLNTSLVDRIEVVRGAQSAVYGSDAVAGVINIITRRPQVGHEQSLSVEVGEDEFANVGISAQGTVDGFEYSLELASRDDGDPVPGSERDSDSVNLRLGWQVSKKHWLQAGYRYLDGDRKSYPEQSGGPEFAVSDALDESDYDERILSVGWTGQLSQAWQSRVQVNRFEHEEDYSSPGIFPYDSVPPNAADTDFTRDQVQWVNTVVLAPGFTASAGADYRDEEGKSDGYLEFFGDRLATDFDLDRDTLGLFASIAASPLQQLAVQGSIRYDDPDDFDSETSLQLGTRYDIGAGVSLSANWGEAYKLPSFFALGHALVGNPDLQPEQADSWDLGLAWQPSDGLRLETTYFFNDYQDLVDFDPDTFENVNRENIETSGVEVQLDWQALESLVFVAQGTYTDIDPKNEDTVLTGRPEWTAGLVARWQFLPQWHSTLDYHYNGEQWATSLHTGVPVSEELDDFHRLDWVLTWQPLPAWELQLSVDNLLDEDYETAVGFTAPDRAVRFALRFTR